MVAQRCTATKISVWHEGEDEDDTEPQREAVRVRLTRSRRHGGRLWGTDGEARSPIEDVRLMLGFEIEREGWGLEVEGKGLEREGGCESEADTELPSWREVVRDWGWGSRSPIKDVRLMGFEIKIEGWGSWERESSREEIQENEKWDSNQEVVSV